jgi:hypothetical protein
LLEPKTMGRLRNRGRFGLARLLPALTPVLVPAALVLGGCAAAASDPVAGLGEGAGADVGAASSAITNGVPATGHDEAVLLRFDKGGKSFVCSGALLSARVVLTAGHCVVDVDAWEITAPFANSTATAHDSDTLDYHTESEQVDPTKHDFGLVFLDQAIHLDHYPVIGKHTLAPGTQVVNYGRILNNTNTDSFFMGRPVAVDPGGPIGFPFDYVSDDIIEPGDSGGPVELVEAAQRGKLPPKSKKPTKAAKPGARARAVTSQSDTVTIVAVNSGADSKTQVLARVDLEPVTSFIEDAIAAHCD